MSNAPVRAVVFDLGGTLWFNGSEPAKADIDRMQAELLQPWLARTSVAIPVPLEIITREIWDAYLVAWQVEMDRGTLREPSLPFLIRGAFAVRGVELSQVLAEAFWRESWIPAHRFGIELYPDTLDVLRALRARGLRIGINSNRPCTTSTMMDDLAGMGIAPYVHVGVSSGETGFIKPHPSTFVRVLEDLGVAPHEAVMVGDDAGADMRGAKAVGMRTVWKLNGRYGAPECRDADFTIHELGELLGLPLFGGPSLVLATESLTPHEDANEERY